jgi:alpha,alpha-trehalose phosphorylase
LDVHPQAENFTKHQMWDFAHTAPDQYPLMLHFPYFDLYRKQVVKQADLVLAMHLRCDAFTPDQKARNFDYYERITVRDSSLSACTQSVMAAEVGHLELAYDYLGEAALMDLDNLEHNTRDGVHIASLAGTWIALVSGLGGLRHHDDGRLAFRPRLPQAISRLAFNLFLRRQRVCVEIGHDSARYSVADGSPVDIIHYGRPVRVTPGDTVELPIPAITAPPPPTQPPGREPAHRARTGNG